MFWYASASFVLLLDSLISRLSPGRQDSALMRPGRLDRILYVGPPDLVGRKDILRIQTHKMSVDSEVDLEHLAQVVRVIQPHCPGSIALTSNCGSHVD